MHLSIEYAKTLIKSNERLFFLNIKRRQISYSIILAIFIILTKNFALLLSTLSSANSVQKSTMQQTRTRFVKKELLKLKSNSTIKNLEIN